MMRSSLIGTAGALLMSASSAQTDTVCDASAELETLKHGDAKTAVQLFTRAIGSGSLSQADLEYAYVARAKAYLQERRRDLAHADAGRALQINPSDSEALALASQTIDRAPSDTSQQTGESVEVIRGGLS
jgi:tetratricopeptide (TPR) repeat protein